MQGLLVSTSDLSGRKSSPQQYPPRDFSCENCGLPLIGQPVIFTSDYWLPFSWGFPFLAEYSDGCSFTGCPAFFFPVSHHSATLQFSAEVLGLICEFPKPFFSLQLCSKVCLFLCKTVPSPGDAEASSNLPSCLWCCGVQAGPPIRTHPAFMV